MSYTNPYFPKMNTFIDCMSEVCPHPLKTKRGNVLFSRDSRQYYWNSQTKSNECRNQQIDVSFDDELADNL